jgi:hypothetical protein
MTAVGFRVKSGYAIAVVLDGSRETPRPVASRIVELSDPAIAETRQPYHDGFYKTEEDARELARRVAIVKRCARKSVAALLEQMEGEAVRLARSEPVDQPPRSALRRSAVASAKAEGRARSEQASAGRPVTRAALVVGSLIDPATVANPHIRAHAHEGQLFRTVLQESLAAHAVDCDVIVDKQLGARAAEELGRPASAVARTVAWFGKTLGGRWRAEEKAAATAAWLALRP